VAKNHEFSGAGSIDFIVKSLSAFFNGIAGGKSRKIKR
jgi:hypothetical protein